MKSITEEQITSIKNFVFRNGRLLERQLFVHVFEHDNEDPFLKALKAYQNEDGGFGNGIEPDILCPESSAIGAETALLFLDHIGAIPSDIVEPLVEWLEAYQQSNGEIPHPPKTMASYPHEPWWKNPDGYRVLSVAGLLSKMGIKTERFHDRVQLYYSSLEKKAELTYYDYPYFLYLKYCGSTADDRNLLDSYYKGVAKICDEFTDHYPMFSPWLEAADRQSEEFLIQESQRVFASGLQDDGSLKIRYENLPWWRPIWTMNCIVSLKRLDLL